MLKDSVIEFFTSESVLLWMMREWNEQKRIYEAIFKENDLNGTELKQLKNPRETARFLKRIHYPQLILFEKRAA